ncbi:alpha/beta fold hydrolase [Nocardioides sp. JQ2195]|uniref:alpha/beta fold hydrolase n=1 Tax=Nocardioides sp. JQ2195 TaxID=2592334 RepID=UPI00143EE144|nr:alpha/beta fold hydrolase [Nocardioides sp. JQ2195]QIX28219.1 alpha/beta fold hydrolase [Nocardioides sp. JQ2195]
MKKLVALIALVAMLLAVAGVATWQLTSVDGDEPDASMGRPASTDAATPSGEARTAPDPALQSFYDQTIAWEPCGANECATLEVPLDYEDPAGSTIELNLLKRPADDPSAKVGNLVVNPGGPGAPGTSYAEQADFAFGDPLRSAFDIIGFDPRGTGESSPVDCLSDTDLDAYLAEDPSPDTKAEVRHFRDWSLRMGKGCQRLSGDVAAHVSTVEAARDMDVLRAALDDDKLTYFGASYGTKLGATYADLFPERSGRLVLDGAVDVSLTSKELSLGQAAGFERALTAYVDDCLADDCYLGTTRKEALATIKGFLDEVDAEPIEVGDRDLKIGNAFYGIVVTLYNDEYWSILDSALGHALEGDATELLRLADVYASRNASGGYDDNSSEAIWAINCQDDPTYTPVGKIPATFPEFRKASPTFGDVFAWGMEGCEGYLGPKPEKRKPITARGADPLLVVGTTRDPATPYEWAESLAKQLGPALLVTRDGDGHTGYNMGSDCVDDMIEGYLIEGDVPDGDVDCS